MHTIDIPAGASATAEDGREVTFVDGEERCPITSLDALNRVVGFRLYGEEFTIPQSDLVPFKAGGVNG